MNSPALELEGTDPEKGMILSKGKNITEKQGEENMTSSSCSQMDSLQHILIGLFKPRDGKDRFIQFQRKVGPFSIFVIDPVTLAIHLPSASQMSLMFLLVCFH
jgi:hypothetical protein